MIDEALALAEVRTFSTLVHAADGLWSPGGYHLENSHYQFLKEQIHKALPLIKSIAQEYDDALPGRFDDGVNGSYGFSSAISATNELIGILETADKRAAIFGVKGPKLAAVTMHPWVWGGVAQLWDDGHHRDAVSKAASAIFDVYLPQKVQLPKGSQPDAMIGKAFKGPKPFLEIPGYATPGHDRTNAYEGAQYLGLSCAKLVRNLGTHNVTEAGEEVVLLEELAMLSRFARIVDSSTCS